jgi:tetratricopeptide (TPR) repeat protein
VFYQGLMEFSAGQLTAAGDLFEEAAGRLNQVGNRTMEATALMNLGLTRHFSGKPTEALAIYARSDQAFRDIGDERRAAEMEVNLSGLQAGYGIDTAQARRRLRNARTNLEKMGHVDFQLGAMQIDAEIEGYEGRLAQSRQLLRAALAIARDKRNSVRITSLSLSLAQADLETGDYAEALSLAQSPDVESPEQAIVLGSTLTELGDLDGAETALARARSELSAASDRTVQATLEVALGRLDLERGRWTAGGEHFAQAIAMWNDPLVPAPVADAHCGLGESEAALGHLDRARRAFATGLSAAERLSRHRLIVRCRVAAARVDGLGGHAAAALSALRDIPDDNEAQTIGLPLRVSVEYWRARALKGVGDGSAADRARAATTLLATLQQSIPTPYREQFSARPSVREMRVDR